MTNVNVELADVGPTPTVVVRTRATMGELAPVIRRSLDAVWPVLRTADVITGHNVVLYLGDVGRPEGATIEVGVEVTGDLASLVVAGDVHRSELPGTQIARAVHLGPYERLGETHAAVLGWCSDQGHEPTGVSWEIYRDWDDDPSALETEVAHALSTAARSSSRTSRGSSASARS